MGLRWYTGEGVPKPGLGSRAAEDVLRLLRAPEHVRKLAAALLRTWCGKRILWLLRDRRTCKRISKLAASLRRAWCGKRIGWRLRRGAGAKQIRWLLGTLCRRRLRGSERIRERAASLDRAGAAKDVQLLRWLLGLPRRRSKCIAKNAGRRLGRGTNRKRIREGRPALRRRRSRGREWIP